MRYAICAAVGAVALSIGGAAGATVTVAAPTTVTTTGPTTASGTTTIGYSDNFSNDTPEPTSFTEYLSFMNDAAGNYSITLTTSTAAVDFTNLLTELTGSGGGSWDLTKIADDGTNEYWNLVTYLAAGTYTLNMVGSLAAQSAGSLGGSITITRAVPEPAAWALMILGFAGLGFAMRRQPRPAFAQIA